MHLQQPAQLAVMEGVSLHELDRAQLHDRIESKMLLPVDGIDTALGELARDYLVLDHDGRRTQRYANHYFDDASLRNYHDHHNQNGRRIKVRYRTYVNSDLTYFELKRLARGRTVKHRRRSTVPAGRLAPGDAAFFYRHTERLPSQLHLSLVSSYERILLVRRDFSERVTIDFNLTFDDGRCTMAMPQLAICEFKQQKFDRRSAAMAAIGRRPQTFSKYCMGLASCDLSLTRNRFKKVFRSLDRLGVDVVPTYARAA